MLDEVIIRGAGKESGEGASNKSNKFTLISSAYLILPGPFFCMIRYDMIPYRFYGCQDTLLLYRCTFPFPLLSRTLLNIVNVVMLKLSKLIRLGNQT